MIRQLNLRSKLRISFLVLVLFSSFTGMVAIYYMSLAYEYNIILKLVQQYGVYVQQMREAEQNFIQYDRKDVQFLETGSSQNRSKLSALYDSLSMLNNKLFAREKFTLLTSADQLKTILTHLNRYKSAFNQLAEVYKKRGFYNHGLEVEMRKYIHELQEAPSAEEQVFAYKLRRNEKDFMLRSDEKYVEEFRKNLSAFRELVANGNLKHMTTEYRQSTLQKIESYKKLFLQLVAYEKELGLSENDGLKGQLKEHLSAVFPLLGMISAELNSRYEKLIRMAYVTLIAGLVVLLVIGVALGIFLSKIITRPLRELDEAINKAARGDYSGADSLQHKDQSDEIGRLSANFSRLINTIKGQFSEIQEKNRSLEIAVEQDNRRNWANDGLAKLSELMNRNQHLHQMLDQVLPALIKYTGGNQGAFFLVNRTDEQNPFLELVSCYAYDRKKYLNKKINPGEGLAGAVWLEKEPMILTHIPQGYVHITSGLGEATPTFLIIIPVMHNNLVEGVAEFAYFRKLENHEIEFLKNVCSRLAVAISTLRIHDKTQKLLAETQLMTEQLRAQEEEMRQNMEELQATQEEMERKMRAARQHTEHLSMALSAYESWMEEESRALIVADTRGGIRFISRNIRSCFPNGHSEYGSLRITDIIPDFNVNGNKLPPHTGWLVSLGNKSYLCRSKTENLEGMPYHIINMEPCRQTEKIC